MPGISESNDSNYELSEFTVMKLELYDHSRLMTSIELLIQKKNGSQNKRPEMSRFERYRAKQFALKTHRKRIRIDLAKEIRNLLERGN